MSDSAELLARWLDEFQYRGGGKRGRPDYMHPVRCDEAERIVRVIRAAAKVEEGLTGDGLLLDEWGPKLHAALTDLPGGEPAPGGKDGSDE